MTATLQWFNDPPSRLSDFGIEPGELVRICDCYNSKQLANCIVLGEHEYRDNGIYMARYLHKGRIYEIPLDSDIVMLNQSDDEPVAARCDD